MNLILPSDITVEETENQILCEKEMAATLKKYNCRLSVIETFVDGRLHSQRIEVIPNKSNIIKT